MNPKAPKDNQDFDFIAKCQSIADGKRLPFDSSFFQMNPSLFNQILKAYSEKLIFFGETNAEKHLQETLISLSIKLKEQNISKRPIMANENNPPVQSQPLTMIVVNKQRDEEYGQEIDSQWKVARNNFFHHQIKQKPSQTRKLQWHQPEIVKIVMQAEQCKHFQRLSIDLNENGGFYGLNQQIKQMNQSLRSINQQFSRRQKENPAISRIIKLKLTQLQVISIQYSLNIDQQYRYEVSAFALFKVIHQNRGLSSVTLKGVKVKTFKKFIKQMAQHKLNQYRWKDEERSWMKEFKPSNSLKIAIETEDSFNFLNKNCVFCTIKDLAQFGGLFKQMSVISVYIKQRQYNQLSKDGSAFQQLQEQLKMMGKIRLKIKIEGEYSQTCDQPSVSVLLHMLSSLTTITQLQFIRMKFNPQTSINRLLAMEQIISSIFQKNIVTHLKLQYCTNFPIFPTITTLQTIVLQSVSFRRQSSFFSELAQSPSLQSIKYRNMGQEWKIQEQLFNQLKRLQTQDTYAILDWKHLGLGILAHSPSNIKCLVIQGPNIGNGNHLSVLFSKLHYITQLSLFLIDFGYQELCTIPSPQLTLLRIGRNNKFENQGLAAIDKKWPKLRQFTLKRCPKLNESGWSACEFNGLIRLQIDQNVLKLGHQIRQQLRWRGVRVY